MFLQKKKGGDKTYLLVTEEGRAIEKGDIVFQQDQRWIVLDVIPDIYGDIVVKHYETGFRRHFYAEVVGLRWVVADHIPKF